MTRIFRANINSLLSRAEDPERVLEELLQEMKNGYREAKQRVASALVEQKKLERELEKIKWELERTVEKGENALASGRRDEASELLARAKELKRQREEFERHLATQRRLTENLKTSLKALKKKIEDARRRKSLLTARRRVSAASVTVSEKVLQMSDETEAFDEFERIASSIEEQVMKADAMLELEEDASRGGGPESFDEELALEFRRLKGEAGLLEAPESAAPTEGKDDSSSETPGRDDEGGSSEEGEMYDAVKAARAVLDEDD